MHRVGSSSLFRTGHGLAAALAWFTICGCNLVGPVPVDPPDAWGEDTSNSPTDTSVAPDTTAPGSARDTGNSDTLGPDTVRDVRPDAAPEPTCDDGRRNGDESGIDCGGSECPACSLQERCEVDGDCLSEHCSMGECVATCEDGIQNGTESDLDCGGAECDRCTAGESCTEASDCATGWCDEQVCKVRISGALEVGDPGTWSDGTVAESCEAYRRPDEDDHVYTSKEGTPGDGIYRIELDPDASPVEVYCEMDRAEGGWTLVAVSADDGTDTWTWADRTLFTTDTTTFGSPDARKNDYKSRAYHELNFEDLLFVYRPDAKWIAYDGAGSGNQSIAARIEQEGRTCYSAPDQSDNVRTGLEPSAGNVSAQADLCSTDLYFSPKDQDGSAGCGDDEHAFGPAWNAGRNTGCPMDDPGQYSGMGPLSRDTDREVGSQGFAKPLGLDADGDSLRLFVR